MAYLEWEDKYKVHHEEVDRQHQHLFDLLNRLYDSVMEGSERGTLGEILNDLIEYTVYHFQIEEDLFKTIHYPKSEEHKQIHDDLTQTAVELQEKFSEGSATISFETLDFLRDWLTRHTLEEDQEWGRFINP